MTREIRIRAPNYSEADATTSDCYLDPNDPIHAIKMAEMTGISVESALARMKVSADMKAYEDRQNSPEMEFAKKYNIRPGTPAWNALWGK